MKNRMGTAIATALALSACFQVNARPARDGTHGLDMLLTAVQIPLGRGPVTRPEFAERDGQAEDGITGTRLRHPGEESCRLLRAHILKATVLSSVLKWLSIHR